MTTPATAPGAPRLAPGTFFTLLAATGFAAVSILTSLATAQGLSLSTVLAWRYVLAAVVLTGWVATHDYKRIPPNEMIRFVTIGGFGQALLVYLALSSLAYGYYRLSQQAAATPNDDPELVARLERWNALLARAYASSPQDADFQDSVREAALDLRRRAPPVALSCLDASGGRVSCDSTEAVLRDIDRLRDEVGVRGALSRLLGRFFGGGGDGAR